MGTKPKVPALMFQGTCSNAGKSLMTMAWCRILSDMGYKVAPFKAQNMSLNSGVTLDGGEIGRAQMLQAAACRIEPETAMNPVLMKPNSDNGSQIIIRGKPWQNMDARSYYGSREQLQREIFNAYDDLASHFDVIVLEGAGSPGEVNLKKTDMVNMPMARYAQSQVILVGDIDRGGVYASFIGHYTVMEKWEKNLLAGYIVNKFRGDATLLDEAHIYMQQHTGKKVVGIMPYVKNHNLPEEDGVDFEKRYGKKKGNSERLKIGIAAFPHISNSTDIDPLTTIENLELCQIKQQGDIAKYRINLLILPGSKNVISDLKWLKQSGIANEIISYYKKNALSVLGICGGFQMLGKLISDPYGVETSAGSQAEGLGLLDCETVLERDKSLKQSKTVFLEGNSPVKGYEIHHGKSHYRSRELFSTPGLGTGDNGVWGTYLHGILENHNFTSYILEKTAEKSGIKFLDEENIYSDMDSSIDAFTKLFRESVDIDFLMKATGL